MFANRLKNSTRKAAKLFWPYTHDNQNSEWVHGQIFRTTRPSDNASNFSTNQRASPTHQDKPTQQAATLRALSQATTSTKTSSVSSSRYNVTTKRQQNEFKNDHASQTNRQNIPVIVQPRDTPPNRSMDRRIKNTTWRKHQLISWSDA